MKKLYVNKSDEVALVAEKVIDSEDKEIVLNIPKFSHLAGSLSNFHLIKREADALGKKVVIESVDDRVIELAEMSGLEAINPFFAKSQKQFSDIVAPGVKRAAEVRRQRINAPEDVIKKGKAKPVEKPKIKFMLPTFKISGKPIIFAAIGAIVVAAAVWLAVSVLPRAEIKIVAKKIDWAYKDSAAAEKSLAAVNVGAAKIPAQVFIQKKNGEISFRASGKKMVEKSAGGTMIIYNTYSSEPQPLVARTRFAASDGKVFRLADNITVPGAKIVEGKIVPSTIEAKVVADKPGEDYNIGPVNYFSIPGFKGTPKYEAFYGETKEPMKGGFIGEVGYPTDEDIKKAKATAAKTLEDAAKTALLTQVPGDFKIIEGSSQFKLLKQELNMDVDEAGNFGVFTEGEMTLIAFKEEDLLEMLTSKIKNEFGDEHKFKDHQLSYGIALTDFSAGKMTFPIDFKGMVVREIDITLLRERALGKSEADLKSLIFSLPGLDSAKITFWPFWVNKVPNDAGRVKIIVE